MKFNNKYNLISIFTCWMIVFIGLGELLLVTDQINAAGPTEISGLISEDTIWTATNSPYIIKDNTTLMSGKILTIQAGTVVKFINNTQLTIRGTLNVKGNSLNNVVFTANDPLYNYSIGVGTYLDKKYYNGTGTNYKIYIDSSNEGKINISYAKFEYSAECALRLENSFDSKITNTIFLNNKCSLSRTKEILIRQCIFKNNYEGIGVNSHFLLYDSIFQNNSFGLRGTMGFTYNCTFIENTYGVVEPGTVKYCTLLNNDIGIATDGGTFTNNSIYNNTIGIIHANHGDFRPFKNNNIYNNTNYNLVLTSTFNIKYFDNWWGTTNKEVIDLYIYDIWEDPNLGEANYEPFLKFPVDTTLKPPVANAGPDQNVTVGQEVYFDGSASYNPSGYYLRYKWNFGDGNSTDWKEDGKTSHIYDIPGNNTVTLTIIEGALTDNDTCVVYVSGIEENNTPLIPDGNSDPNTTPNDNLSNNKDHGISFTSTFGIIITSIIIVSLITIISSFIVATEIGKYSIFSAIGPLYTKKRKKGDLKYIKGSIRGYILGNPGERYNDIKKILKLSNGTLTYYLNVLEREGIIRSEREGFNKRFYPKQGKSNGDFIELTEIQQTIKWVIKNNPGISQKDIQSQLGISQQRLNYHIQLMENARIIRIEKEGNKSKCFVIEEVS